MKPSKFFLLSIIFVVSTSTLFGQRVGFIATDLIREKFPEAKQAEQRIRSIVEEWKRELEDLDKRVENLKFEISKNRLIWSDEEKRLKEKELEDLNVQKLMYSRKRFEPGGEYDMVVKTIMQPIEDKIYAAIQKVAAENGFDIIWDKSNNPLAYVNYKYDLTLKVLRELGVDVAEMERELEEKIAKDPRNKIQVERETPSSIRKKQRTKKEVEPKQPENQGKEEEQNTQEEKPK